MSDRVRLLLEFADDELILGWRDSEWTGIAPFLEEDVAFSSIAQNEIGHARALYELAARELGGDADSLAFDRRPEEYRCAPLVQPRLVGDWAATIARHVLYENADAIRLEELKRSDDSELAGLAAKMDREEVYHRLHAEMWLARLGSEERLRAALEKLWPAALGLLDPSQRPQLAERIGLAEVDAVERTAPGSDFAELWDEMTMVRRSAPAGAMVTADAVWEALAEIPDPEIPVISLVDLGVVKSVEIQGELVHVEFTPTFMGCPALEAMKSQMEAAIVSLGAEPHVDVVLDDSWSTDRISAEGREKLRVAGFAPPTPRAAGPTTLVQLRSKAFRCPYCDSADTRLENIFGPTPCRSVRYCESCRQPFEQFKTI